MRSVYLNEVEGAWEDDTDCEFAEDVRRRSVRTSLGSGTARKEKGKRVVLVRLPLRSESTLRTLKPCVHARTYVHAHRHTYLPDHRCKMGPTPSETDRNENVKTVTNVVRLDSDFTGP